MVLKLLACTALTAIVGAASAETLDSRFTNIGTIKPRSALERAKANITNNFSIGFETTDRGFSDPCEVLPYTSVYPYCPPGQTIDRMGPLGVGRARVQSGWADIERTPGVYTWGRLDFIINQLSATGIKPYLDLLYGNEHYTNGGTRYAKTLPTFPARAPWLTYVDQLVVRYGSKVTEWEIWNEPDLVDPDTKKTGVDVTLLGQFFFDTATAIKKRQSGAKIVLGSFSSISQTSREYIDTALGDFEKLRAAVKPSDPGYISENDVYVSYHPYDPIPDKIYPASDGRYDKFIAILAKYGYKPWQGENGVNSAPNKGFALGNLAWDEDDQARFFMRRMLGDKYRGVISNIFSAIEMHYTSGKNYKGLMEVGDYYTNSADRFESNTNTIYGDRKFKRYKLGYGVMKNMTSVFDDRLTPVTDAGCTTTTTGYTIQAYTRNDNGTIRNLLAVWRSNEQPGTNEAQVNINVTCTKFKFVNYANAPTKIPYYADLLSGNVYSIAQGSPLTVENTTSGLTIRNLPTNDYPIVVADQGIVSL